MIEQSTTKVDLLVFAPHPDDAELFCGGLLLQMKDAGYKTGVIDLTKGELSSGGDPLTRAEEVKQASKILGLAVRENLALGDGKINPYAGTEEGDASSFQLERVVSALRRHRPEIVLVPYWTTRHPDHSAASVLVSRAVFFSGVKKFAAPSPEKHFIPQQVLFYPMRAEGKASFVTDVSAVHAKKLEAIQCYNSQLHQSDPVMDSDGIPPLISSPLSLVSIEARDRYYGMMIGRNYGEPYITRNILSINDPLAHFRKNPNNSSLILPRE